MQPLKKCLADLHRHGSRARESVVEQARRGAVHSAAVVDQGSPLGKTKGPSAQGISGVKNDMTGFVIVQAESHESAARLFENHSHFVIFPGDSAESMACLPLPGLKTHASLFCGEARRAGAPGCHEITPRGFGGPNV